MIGAGFKANISDSVTCFDDRDYRKLPIYQETLDTYPAWHGAGDGRLRLDLSVHAVHLHAKGSGGGGRALRPSWGCGPISILLKPRRSRWNALAAIAHPGRLL